VSNLVLLNYTDDEENQHIFKLFLN